MCELSTPQILLARHSETRPEMLGNSPSNHRCQDCELVGTLYGGVRVTLRRRAFFFFHATDTWRAPPLPFCANDTRRRRRHSLAIWELKNTPPPYFVIPSWFSFYALSFKLEYHHYPAHVVEDV
jgi:hypothetical protein